MKRAALFLSCIGPSILMATAAASADSTLQKPGLLFARPGDAGAPPFDLRASAPSKPAAGPRPGAGTLMQSTDPNGGMPPGRPAAGPEQRSPANRIDESALRFYASQNDAARVSMEIKRLKARHPSWEPPSDLFDEARDPALEQKLWDLFGEGRLDEIKSAVLDIRKADPTWRPSDKFVQEFDRAELRAQVAAASDAKDAAGVLALAEGHPGMLVCAEIDVMWRVAQALVETSEVERAQDLYKYILTHCSNSAERLATVQKAMELLPSSSVKALIALGQRRSTGGSEFESVRLDLVRRQLGAMASDPASEPLSAPELRNFEDLTRKNKQAGDAALLGWHSYAQKNWSAAAQWFKQAMDWERLPKAAEGYALALRQKGMILEAEAVAYEWREASPLIAKLFVEIVATAMTVPQPAIVEPERLARMEDVVGRIQSVNGAQALGWYYYNVGATQKAQPWFARSVAWEPNEATTLGLALAANRNKDRALFQKTLADFGSRYSAVAALKEYDKPDAPQGEPKGKNPAGGSRAGQLADAAVAQFKNGQYREALATLDERAKIAREDHGLGVLRGWTHYHLMQYDKARDLFAQLDKKQSTSDTQYGLYYSGSKFDTRYRD